MYRGNVSTILREIPGYAFQFACYEGSKHAFKRILNQDELPIWALFISGMIGGFNCWLWSYPQDVIKTRLQLGSYDYKTWDGGFSHVFKQIYCREGYKGFFRGFSAVTIRSTIPNGLGFLAYEFSLKKFKEWHV